ncbi:hypothetical protein N7509_009138 [Penicillium cosmopolitanum]|uniref:Glutaminase n=1 Tax=Penicillium cosmopolitanum TaxID=1131564 RepID=A0A9W9VNW5_9EURO|nr:uncharacterized protein N7509_009138 [Penicillium cosmopolitanum]KAJ5386597.1 hypothetical protein N7509_009138 [Penicillium cosmopolitanum]
MQLPLAVLAAAFTQAALTTASSLTPPVLPLTVRNPYLSTWLGNAREAPWSKWPMFYTGEEIGLSLMAHVPSQGAVYPLVGKPQDSLPSGQVQFPEYLGNNYDASTTNFTYRIDTGSSTPLEITISFLSPITPTSTLRQSIPASYVTIDVRGDTNVNVYMDIDARWVTGDHGTKINWAWDTINVQDKTSKSPALQRWQIRREQELHLSEIRDRAEWGTLHFTGPANARFQSGEAAKVRRSFAKTGSLTNENDDDFRSIDDRSPVFSFSQSFNLGHSAKKSSESVTFTLALIQIPVVQYAAARGLTMMRPLWESWFPTTEELLTFHYNDHAVAASLASNYSIQVAKDAYLSGADDYVDIVALSARQVMGATTFSGTPEDPILFLKEISSNGNFQTIDVIFPAFPFFLYTNPLDNTPTPMPCTIWGPTSPMPPATPDGNDEYMPVEECGNILIMGLAIANSLQYEDSSTASSIWSAQGSPSWSASSDSDSLFPLSDLQTFSGIAHQDGKWGGGIEGQQLAKKWVQRSYTLWKQWTGYLVEFSLEPANQLSTDDFAGWLALQTNLALKGIVGINAMSKLAELTGHDSDAKYFKDTADKYIAKWEEYGMSRDNTHAKLAYDWYGSWTTIYNLYADAQLCFHLEGTNLSSNESAGFVPRHIYQKQSIWYHYVRQKYGLPLDSRHLYTKTDWEFFSMAVASKPVRSEILESVARWVNETVTDRPFTDLHKTEGDGNFPGPNFFARPVIGGHFAFLALERACGGQAMRGLSFLDDIDEQTFKKWSASAEAAVKESQLWRHGSGEL